MAHQLTLQFPVANPIVNGKKLARIPVACSDEFKSWVQNMAKLQGSDVSTICHRYILEGMQRDLGTVFMAEPHADKRLRDFMAGS